MKTITTLLAALLLGFSGPAHAVESFNLLDNSEYYDIEEIRNTDNYSLNHPYWSVSIVPNHLKIYSLGASYAVFTLNGSPFDTRTSGLGFTIPVPFMLVLLKFYHEHSTPFVPEVNELVVDYYTSTGVLVRHEPEVFFTLIPPGYIEPEQLPAEPVADASSTAVLAAISGVALLTGRAMTAGN